MKSFSAKFIFVLCLICGFQNVGFGQSANSPLVKCWEFFVENLTNLIYASDNVSEIYLPLGDGKILATNSFGQTIWTSEFSGEFSSGIVYSNKKLYFATSEGSRRKTTIHSVSSITGLTIWNKKLENLTNDIQIFPSQESVVILNQGGNIYILNKNNGEIEKEYKIRETVTSNYLYENGTIYYSTENGNLNQILLDKGEMKKISSIKKQKINLIENSSKNHTLLSSHAGQLTLIRRDTGKKVWSNRIGGSINSVTKIPDYFLISSFDNYIYLISIESGKIVWRNRFNTTASTEFLANLNVAVSSLVNGQTTALTKISNGKVVNQIAATSEDFFINKPLILGDKIFLFQNRSIISYEFDKCSNKKE